MGVITPEGRTTGETAEASSQEKSVTEPGVLGWNVIVTLPEATAGQARRVLRRWGTHHRPNLASNVGGQTFNRFAERSPRRRVLRQRAERERAGRVVLAARRLGFAQVGLGDRHQGLVASLTDRRREFSDPTGLEGLDFMKHA
jgi:hypothetical protein